MRDRHARLDRIVALFELQKRVHQARAARLRREDLALAAREEKLVELLVAGCGATLREATVRQLSKCADERAAASAKLEEETVTWRKIERRARVGAQALEHIETRLDDKMQRTRLEEMQFGASPVSGKFRGSRI